MSHNIKKNKTVLKRLYSLDIFRGLTVALMILVNSPGYQQSFAWAKHSNWNGCTLADVVFPFFLFIVGMSIALAFSSLKSNANAIKKSTPIILKKTFVLLLIGIAFNLWSSHFSFDSLRYYGVLQRIAICYALASFIFLSTSLRKMAIIVALMLSGYWLSMLYMPLNGLEIGQLTPYNNLAAYIVRFLFSANHLYGKTYDPEGLLSTLPALAKTLSGVITCCWFRGNHSAPSKKIWLYSRICG
jgi:predicted acyltransferase